MMKQWIVLDIDDTVTDFTAEAYVACNAATGRNISIEDNPSYFVHKHFDMDVETFHDVLLREAVYDKLVPTPGIREALQLAMDADIGVMFLTARGVVPQGEAITVRWLAAHALPHDNLTCCTFKETKNDFLPERTRLVAEDNAHHLRGMALPTYRFLISKPWNVHEPMPNDVRRINQKALPWQITKFVRGML
jgi:uncharacterized HAD superfamily protein